MPTTLDRSIRTDDGKFSIADASGGIPFQEIDRAYLKVLYDVYFHPQFSCAPRGIGIKEILNYHFTVERPGLGPIRTHDLDRNEVIAKYTEAETKLYLSQTRDSEEWATHASSFWRKIANPDGSINSAYGWMVFGRKIVYNEKFSAPSWFQEHKGGLKPDDVAMTPWEWAKLCLETDRDTRQAIIWFNTPDIAFPSIKDFPCTMFGQFFIRNNELHFSISMRSNDVVKGLVFDMAWFVYLMHRMKSELASKYPDLQLGTYYHHAGSMHAYDKDQSKIETMLGYAIEP